MHKKFKLSLKRDRYLFPSFSQIEDKYPPNKSPGMRPGVKCIFGRERQNCFPALAKKKIYFPPPSFFPLQSTPGRNSRFKKFTLRSGKKRGERGGEQVFLLLLFFFFFLRPLLVTLPPSFSPFAQSIKTSNEASPPLPLQPSRDQSKLFKKLASFLIRIHLY